MYTKEVQKIHNEFNSAGDKLIEAANAIVAKGLLERSSAKQLIELGFTECKEAKQYRTLEQIRNNGILAEEYQNKYPLYKFITRQQVDKICSKYGLLIGGADRYKGKIPAKNIKEIVSFKVQDEDLNELSLWNLTNTLWVDVFGTSNRSDKKEPKKLNRNLSICAPKAMMNLEGAEVIGNEIRASDPVVLHPVKGGYLIVTAWGEEASDPIVVNDKMN